MKSPQKMTGYRLRDGQLEPVNVDHKALVPRKPDPNYNPAYLNRSMLIWAVLCGVS